MNSELYGNSYRIPENIIKKIQAKLYANSGSGDGVRRAKNLVKNGVITYQAMKRLKNFFDSFNPENDSLEQYELAGGEEMKRFIEHKLGSERDKTEKSQQIKRDVGVGNNYTIKAQTGKVEMIESVVKNPLHVVGLAAIFNNDNDILLLKRSATDDWILFGE
jgi:hypothetical protein